jgi:hypothetical protein
MTDPRELQASDIVQIHREALSDTLWRVTDAEVEDIGITETFAVALVSAAEGADSQDSSASSPPEPGSAGEDDNRSWLIVGTTADSTATLEEPGTDDGGESHTVNWNDIELQ